MGTRNKCGTLRMRRDRRCPLTWANALTKSPDRRIMSSPLYQPSCPPRLLAREKLGEKSERKGRDFGEIRLPERILRPGRRRLPLWRGRSWWRGDTPAASMNLVAQTGYLFVQAVLGTLKDPSITSCREIPGEAGAHVCVSSRGLEPAHAAGWVQTSCFPQDLAVTHRIGPATARFVRLHLRLRQNRFGGPARPEAALAPSWSARQHGPIREVLTRARSGAANREIREAQCRSAGRSAGSPSSWLEEARRRLGSSQSSTGRERKRGGGTDS